MLDCIKSDNCVYPVETNGSSCGNLEINNNCLLPKRKSAAALRSKCDDVISWPIDMLNRCNWSFVATWIACCEESGVSGTMTKLGSIQCCIKDVYSLDKIAHLQNINWTLKMWIKFIDVKDDDKQPMQWHHLSVKANEPCKRINKGERRVEAENENKVIGHDAVSAIILFNLRRAHILGPNTQ